MEIDASQVIFCGDAKLQPEAKENDNFLHLAGRIKARYGMVESPETWGSCKRIILTEAMETLRWENITTVEMNGTDDQNASIMTSSFVYKTERRIIWLGRPDVASSIFDKYC